jgi:hypothetical protein
MKEEEWKIQRKGAKDAKENIWRKKLACEHLGGEYSFRK